MTAVRQLADRYLDELCALDPALATSLGLPGHDHELPDYSPDASTERATLARRTLVELAQLQPADDIDRRCAALLRDRLGLSVEADEAGEPLRNLRVMGWPVEDVRSSFDLMSASTPEDWETIATRIEAAPAALASFVTSLREGMRRGVFAAPRQALACAEQTATWSGDDGEPGFFPAFVADGPAALRPRLDAAAAAATEELRVIAGFLRSTYAPAAAHQPDAVGPERYAMMVRESLGAQIDVAEAYEWAWDELHRIEAEMVTVARQIVPGGDLSDAYDYLETEGEAITGAENLCSYLQDLVDRTIADLQGTHFDLDERIRRVEVMVAPPGGTAAQYYTSPSADFSRPGQTWNPINGRSRFPVWNEISTCFHEAVPGHHMQFGQWTLIAHQLSRFQTSMFVSGNIEGWALYAERLMEELGFLSEPGARFGFLVAQQLRATRVIVDAGMHLQLRFPSHQAFHPGEVMSPELGHEFLMAHAGRDHDFLESEFLRYLGLPAQAISYKLGERVWLAGREAARRRRGASFDLKAWHMAALNLGSLGLDDLADELPLL